MNENEPKYRCTSKGAHLFPASVGIADLIGTFPHDPQPTWIHLQSSSPLKCLHLFFSLPAGFLYTLQASSPACRWGPETKED